MLLFVTDGPWGVGAGRPLTATEVDNNFWDHEGRIAALEDNPPVPISVSTVTIAGSVLTFHMTDGSTHNVTAPVATFHWRGDFKAGTAYAVLDEIRVGGVGRVLVLKAHTGADPFDIDRQVTGSDAYFLLEELGIIFNPTPIDESRDITEDDFSRYHDVIPGSSGEDIELTIQPEGSDFMPQPGTAMDFIMHDATAQLIFLEGAGVTIRSPATLQTRTQWSQVSILYRGSDTWDLTGDLEVV